MNTQLTTSYSIFWLLLIMAIAGLLTYLLYFKNLQSKELQKSKILFLSLLRYVTLVFLGFLLLNPLVKIISNQTQKPIIIFAQDNSASMVLSSDSTFLKDSLEEILKPILSRISDKFEVHRVQFGESVNDISYSFTDKQTNFESLFNEFNTTYFNQNIGALIIASDGLYNKGTAPLYAAQGLSFPIYTIPFGDTLTNADLEISKIEFNEVAYKGSKFPVRVGVKANLLKGKQVLIEVTNGENVLASQNIPINNSNFFKNISFYLNADSVGVFNYKIVAKTQIEESNIFNNSKIIYVEVEDSKRKILLLQNGNHPDAAVFKRIIDQNPAFEIDIENPFEFKGNISDYALVILLQLPSQKNSLLNIWPEIVKNEISLLFVLGSETSIESFNNINLALNINQKNNLYDEVFPLLNNDFNLFNLTLDNNFISEMPPLFAPFGEYSNLLNNQILLYQQLGQIETKKPLWSFAESGNQKIGFIIGEGLWKWRLQEYRKFRDHTITDELVIKTIQYLALKNKKNPFIVEYEKIVNENQEVIFNSKLLNASNELVKAADIHFELIDDNGNIYPYTFKESIDDYSLNLGMLSVGSYKFKATSQLGNERYTKTGIFIVKENLIEQSNLIADHNMLHNLSVNTVGKQFDKSNINALFMDIENNSEIVTISFAHKTLKDIIHMKGLLFILLLVITIEWFFRKIWGII